MKVKVCGITNIEDALYCIESGADALGFMLYKSSKRYVDIFAAREIIIQLPPFTMLVGVFVNEKPKIINYIAEELGLNAVQLHGEETPQVTDEINFPIIKAFRTNKNFDFSEVERFQGITPMFDSDSLKSNFGGTGKTFDWSIIPEEYRRRSIIAGGIGINNIEELINEINPAAIDLSSSLEAKPGIKDHTKVKAFFEKLAELKNK
ncbi:MAG: phosphoribosylanthranilate isomerase [Melioribacteraceae bacterium]|nr:phosphoribosylanthranilate isomerase [Melioribacteraceae bacterium]